jgi:glutaryl-CoA dehydrogenase
MSAVGAGLVMMELRRIESSVATFFALHLGAGDAIDQPAWLRKAKATLSAVNGEIREDRGVRPECVRSWIRLGGIGGHGQAGRKRVGINGRKRWPGNAVWCDYIVICARDVADKQVRAFVVEKDNPGYKATKIQGKVSQSLLVNMLGDVTATQLYCIRLGD